MSIYMYFFICSNYNIRQHITFSVTYYVPFLRPRYKYCRASYDPPFNVFILLFVYNKAMVGIQLNRFLNCDGLNFQWITKYFIRPR